MKRICLLLALFSNLTLGYTQESDSIERAIELNKILSRINHYIDEELPDIELRDINGNIKTISDFNQSVLLLDFWATWCGPCIANIPNQEKVYSRLRDYGINDFEWIKISVDRDTSVWKNLVNTDSIPGINLIGDRKSIEQYYHISHYPTYVLLNNKKRVLGFDISGPDCGITLDWLILLALDRVNCIDAWTSFYTSSLDSIKSRFLDQHEKYFYKYRND